MSVIYWNVLENIPVVNVNKLSDGSSIIDNNSGKLVPTSSLKFGNKNAKSPNLDCEVWYNTILDFWAESSIMQNEVRRVVLPREVDTRVFMQNYFSQKVKEVTTKVFTRPLCTNSSNISKTV